MRLTNLCSSSLNPGKLPYRILFFGTDHFAVSPLKKLVENSRSTKDRIVEHVEVVCPPERRRVINKRFFEDVKHIMTVREYAQQENLPIHYWYGKEGWSDNYSINGPFDVGVVASFGYLITNKILDLCLCGSINIHPSLLPQWRGSAPMSYAILQGAQETGVSIIEVSRNKFDLGKILSQKPFMIPEDIMFDDLSTRLATLGTEMLFDCLANLDESLESAKQQSTKGVSKAPKIVKQLGYIYWNQHTWTTIWRKWRVLSSRVGLHTVWRGKRVRLVTMTRHKIPYLTENDKNAPPGQPRFDKERSILFIKCEDDWAGFTHLQVECKSIISAKDFSNSYLQSSRTSNNKNVFECIDESQ